jgi:hypothetical protein
MDIDKLKTHDDNYGRPTMEHGGEKHSAENV